MIAGFRPSVRNLIRRRSRRVLCAGIYHVFCRVACGEHVSKATTLRSRVVSISVTEQIHALTDSTDVEMCTWLLSRPSPQGPGARLGKHQVTASNWIMRATEKRAADPAFGEALEAVDRALITGERLEQTWSSVLGTPLLHLSVSGAARTSC